MRTCGVESLESRRLLSAADIGVPDPLFLAATDVQAILARAASAARPGQAAAVVDREGTVLGVVVRSGGNTAEAATIADLAVQRARTAAAFQSGQHAFTTRTARFIIQNHFPEPVKQTAGGPLYGVEFSNFPGSDILLADLQSGISGDPGGVPLYLNGVPVGGVGVAGDGRDVSPTKELKQTLIDLRGDYGVRSIRKAFNGTEERDFDESVAIAAATGYSAPRNIQATRVFVDGLRFPFTRSPKAKVAQELTFDAVITGGMGTLVAIPTAGKADPAVTAGSPRLTNGTVAGVEGLFRNRQAAGATAPQEAVRTAINDTISALDASAGDPDDPDSAATASLSKADVDRIIEDAVNQAIVIRAGIREPNGVRAQVHIAVVDRDGDVLGVFRMADGTNFSYDVAVQKARTAAFFSDDDHAISTRALGFVSQKFFPPGIDKGLRGPLFRLQDKATFKLANLADDELANGITVFPGGVPLYKDGVLVGAVGISGDGVDQDDMIAFAGEAGFRPADAIRSDRLDAGNLATHLLSRAVELANDAGLIVDSASDDNDLERFNSDAAERRLRRGLDDVRLPYVKFPRNPFEG